MKPRTNFSFDRELFCIELKKLCRFKSRDRFSVSIDISFLLQTTKRYELLNYSEHGTVVDDVLYCSNYTRVTDKDSKDEKNDKVTYITKEEETSEMIKTILHKEETVPLQQYIHGIDKTSCKCNRRRDITANKHPEEGWEGSAIIAHGSIITFGCLMFVFNTPGTYVDR